MQLKYCSVRHPLEYVDLIDAGWLLISFHVGVVGRRMGFGRWTIGHSSLQLIFVGEI